MAIAGDVRVLPLAADVARLAATLFVESVAAAIEARGQCHVCLAGGSTPRRAYTLLQSADVPWSKLHIYFGDERCVPSEHPESNFHMAKEGLLQHVDVSPRHVHRIPTELGAREAAGEYERTLRRLLGDGESRFDLVFLGMGVDAHTASLFPGTDTLRISDHWCAGYFVPQLGVDRITLTYPPLNAARRIVFLVTEAGKAEALRSVFMEPIDVTKRPAQGIVPIHGELIWLTDRAAAARLPSSILRPQV